MNQTRLIDTITQAYVALNVVDVDEYDPELENRRAELFLELMKSIALVFDEDPEDLIEKMTHYVENSQFFTVQAEVLRVLLCDENMEVNALRILLFSLVRALKERDLNDADALDSVEDEYYEQKDIIYMHTTPEADNEQ